MMAVVDRYAISRDFFSGGVSFRLCLLKHRAFHFVRSKEHAVARKEQQIGARITAKAGASEVLASSAMKDLVPESGIRFQEWRSHDHHRPVVTVGARSRFYQQGNKHRQEQFLSVIWMLSPPRRSFLTPSCAA
jgi:hypothetical protein